MMNRKQFLRDHPVIRCPKNKQQTDRGHFTQKRDLSKAAVMHLYQNHTLAGVPPPPADPPHIP